MSEHEREGKYQTDQDVSTILMLLIGGFFLYILLIILLKYLALAAPYIYYIFAAPVYVLGQSSIWLGMLVVFLYSIVAFGIAFAYKKVSGKYNKIALFYCGFWLIIAVLEFIFTRQYVSAGQNIYISPLTSHIHYFCNPKLNGFLYILTCTATENDIGNIPTIKILSIAFIPNLVIGLNAILTIIKNFGSIKKHPKKKATEFISDINVLINTVAHRQPHLLVYKDIDPNQIDYNSGALRLMDTPRRYVFEHNMVKGFSKRLNKKSIDNYKKFNQPDDIDKKMYFTETDASEFVPVIDVERFEVVMTRDLGAIYTNPDDLTPTQTAVLSLALILTCRGDTNMSEEESKKIRKHCESICDEIFTWTANDIKIKHDVNRGFAAYPKLDDLKQDIIKWSSHTKAKEIFSQHAYINTIILRALMEAKKLGVFQPSSLRWLYFYDRPLYAVVQNESRPSVFAENAATTSHYSVEIKAGRKIYKPQFQIAFDGFMENVTSYRYTANQIKAWEHYRDTGDASLMIDEKMVSEEFSSVQ